MNKINVDSLNPFRIKVDLSLIHPTCDVCMIRGRMESPRHFLSGEGRQAESTKKTFIQNFNAAWLSYL